MASWVYLSHVLSPTTPGYGGKQGFWCEQATSIASGCSSNSSNWKLSNHIGTHIDVPFHFADAGTKVDDYPASDWIYDRPCLVDVKAEPAELIAPAEWSVSIPRDTDLLLIRTGFESRRAQPAYWEQNPGLAPGFGRWLREQLPSVRAIGFDFLSVTSWQHRPEGRIAHRALLDPAEAGRPVIVIEDMALAALKTLPRRVVVAPLRVAGSDGSPATVIAELP